MDDTELSRRKWDNTPATAPKRGFALFVIPACWLVLVGIAMRIGQTSWGIEGHPSNGLILFLLSIMIAPVFGFAGCIYAVMRKAHYSRGMLVAAMVTNMCVLVAPALFWVLVEFTSPSPAAGR
jgi:hypothetical protein